MDLNYLKVKIRESIITDIVNIAIYHSINGGIYAGYFSIPREVFCMVDFLGSISYNNQKINGKKERGSSTRKAVRFIKEFFPTNYKPFANLLIAIWRHGTVHSFVPYVYYVMQGNQKIIIEWTSNQSNENHNRKVNIKTFDKKDCKNTVILSVNICQLADDLLTAFDNFISKMENNPSFRKSCLNRLKRILNMKNCTNKKELKNQILFAKNSTEGLIDNLQVEWYSKG